MVYSLSRWRFHKPETSFSLGGEYVGREGQRYLQDAQGSVELLGSPELFAGLADGDLIVVRVDRAADLALTIGDLRLERKAQSPGLSSSRPQAVRFAAFVDQVRHFFSALGLQEIFTPTLVPCPGLEPSLEPFATTATRGRRELQLYLPTSPELHLKKAMTRGWLDIFEIKSCFRRGEFSEHHENEFLMLEWYRGFADLQLIEADLRALVQTLQAEGWVENAMAPVEPLTTDFATLFAQHFDFSLTPHTSVAELQRLCERLDVNTAASDSFDDLFHRLLVDRLEPLMAQMGPLIVRRFPPSQAALAKLDSAGWADRFEFYWKGLEIANAFNEVCDADEQVSRWQKEMQERARLGHSKVPDDPTLIAALRKGLPSSGGVALGMERLFMACTGCRDIRELRLFSTAELFEP